MVTDIDGTLTASESELFMQVLDDVAPSNAEALPGESGVGAYKLAWLERLLAQGYLIDFAYGNASTDLYAYLEAGLDPSSVWIIGDHAGEQGTHGAVDSWDERVAELDELPAVEQPFAWFRHRVSGQVSP